ncbi:DeoR/GlpR family DNA-binding transcription regulator [Anaerovibrio lipolyticus]|uniref:DeoR/GlpR family DNA-binding transcription regulator n=1 Tax=Anaerovibrio lipolyticus TaxID=82374 RepID=UPI000483F31C|nr:DeoR/GlpR family DNA-binding transcription regulator [Anaerovibrio lipolyticus]
MLTEERYAAILKILAEKKAVTVLELTKALQISESTVRRDLTALHRSGRLYKVYGGATTIDNNYSNAEEDMQTKWDLHPEEKVAIGRKAAELITGEDFVYIDAGSTTLHLIDFLTDNGATFVTNGMQHAVSLLAKGIKVFIIGGAVKAVTEAVVGTEALKSLENYNFTKGFFGTNGISPKSGFSTPDADEGAVKSEAMARCKSAFVLADSSKFNKISPITFAGISSATIITGRLEDKKYRDYTTVLEGE